MKDDKVIVVDDKRYVRDSYYGLMELSDEQPFGPSFVCGLPLWGSRLERVEARIKELADA